MCNKLTGKEKQILASFGKTISLLSEADKERLLSAGEQLAGGTMQQKNLKKEGISNGISIGDRQSD